MSYIVRKVGGGTFNPNAMCFSPDERYLFVACGSQINCYTLPDLVESGTILTHKCHISCIVCDSQHIISSDCSGFIYWHKFNDLTIFEKNPSSYHQVSEPIEKILYRGGKLYYITFHHRLFWVEEFNNSESVLMVTNEMQQSFIKKMHPGLVLNGINPLRFSCLDAFDINEEGNTVCVGDRCKLHIHNFETNSRETIPFPTNVMICCFRGNGDVIAVLASGMVFIHGKHPIIRDHWHFICPNAIAFNNSFIYSGGFEGVLTIYNDRTHRHEFLPRLGLTIEGMSLSSQSTYIAAVIDKNILTLIDTSSKVVREYITNIVDDISFYNNILISSRKPNLIQFFDCKTSKIIEQLQVSSYNSVVPLTSVELSNTFLITVETAGAKPKPTLTQRGQVSLNHKRPRANKAARDYAYEKLLFHDRFAEMKGIQKLKYVSTDGNEEFINKDLAQTELEGNPLVKDPDASSSVNYSEIKIWSRNEGKFAIEQSFRIIGKPVAPLSIHPRLNVFCMMVSHELQIWKRTDRDLWVIWRSTTLPMIPKQIKWSPDGSIVILQYDRTIDIVDTETLKSMYTHPTKSAIITSHFNNDVEIVIHTKVGVSIFDLRSLSEKKHIFAQTNNCSAVDDSIAFVVQKNQPIVVYCEKDEMLSWQIPTNCAVRSLHLLKESGKPRIVIVDEDNFVWSIDQFGIEEKSKPVIATISQPRPKEIKNVVKAKLSMNKIPDLLSLFSAPSHQILSINNLASALFETVCESKISKETASIPVKVDEDQTENENISQPKPYTAKELAEMRAMLTL